MKMNDISRIVLNNWPIKVFSFLLALCIYIIVHFTTTATREVEIPLQVMHPAGYTAVSNIPDTVTLILTGEDRDISVLRSDAVDALADFSLVETEGVQEVPVSLIYDNSLFDVEFSVSSDPAVIKIFYQKDEGGKSE